MQRNPSRKTQIESIIVLNIVNIDTYVVIAVHAVEPRCSLHPLTRKLDLFHDNYEYKRRQTIAARKRRKGGDEEILTRLCPRWPSIPRLIRLEYALNQQGKRQLFQRYILDLVEETRLRSFITARCSFVGDNRRADEGFWRLVVWETCEYESVKRKIGTRCGTWHGACRLHGSRWRTKLRFCTLFWPDSCFRG